MPTEASSVSGIKIIKITNWPNGGFSKTAQEICDLLAKGVKVKLGDYTIVRVKEKASSIVFICEESKELKPNELQTELNNLVRKELRGKVKGNPRNALYQFLSKLDSKNDVLKESDTLVLKEIAKHVANDGDNPDRTTLLTKKAIIEAPKAKPKAAPKSAPKPASVPPAKPPVIRTTYTVTVDKKGRIEIPDPIKEKGLTGLLDLNVIGTMNMAHFVKQVKKVYGINMTKAAVREFFGTDGKITAYEWQEFTRLFKYGLGVLENNKAIENVMKEYMTALAFRHIPQTEFKKIAQETLNIAYRGLSAEEKEKFKGFSEALDEIKEGKQGVSLSPIKTKDIIAGYYNANPSIPTDKQLPQEMITKVAMLDGIGDTISERELVALGFIIYVKGKYVDEKLEGVNYLNIGEKEIIEKIARYAVAGEKVRGIKKTSKESSKIESDELEEGNEKLAEALKLMGLDPTKGITAEQLSAKIESLDESEKKEEVVNKIKEASEEYRKVVVELSIDDKATAEKVDQKINLCHAVLSEIDKKAANEELDKIIGLWRERFDKNNEDREAQFRLMKQLYITCEQKIKIAESNEINSELKASLKKESEKLLAEASKFNEDLLKYYKAQDDEKRKALNDIKNPVQLEELMKDKKKIELKVKQYEVYNTHKSLFDSMIKGLYKLATKEKTELKKEPKDDAKKVVALEKDAGLTWSEREFSADGKVAWYKVKTEKGKEGWVKAELVERETIGQEVNRAIMKVSQNIIEAEYDKAEDTLKVLKGKYSEEDYPDLKDTYKKISEAIRSKDVTKLKDLGFKESVLKAVKKGQETANQLKEKKRETEAKGKQILKEGSTITVNRPLDGRTGPDTGTGIIQLQGKTIEIQSEEKNGFVKVKVKGGQECWVYKRLLPRLR